MSGLPGSHRPVSGTAPRVLHTFPTVHPATPSLLQHALLPAGVPWRHRSPLETARVPRVSADSEQQSARRCSHSLQSDAPPLRPDLHSLPTTALRSHTIGQLL